MTAKKKGEPTQVFELAGPGCELVVGALYGELADDLLKTLKKNKNLDINDVLDHLGVDDWSEMDDVFHFNGPLEGCVLVPTSGGQDITPPVEEPTEVTRNVDRIIVPTNFDNPESLQGKGKEIEKARYFFVGASFNKGVHGEIRIPTTANTEKLALIIEAPEYGDEFNLICGIAYDGEALEINSDDSSNRQTEAYFWIFDRKDGSKLWSSE